MTCSVSNILYYYRLDAIRSCYLPRGTEQHFILKAVIAKATATMAGIMLDFLNKCGGNFASLIYYHGPGQFGPML